MKRETPTMATKKKAKSKPSKASKGGARAAAFKKPGKVSTTAAKKTTAKKAKMPKKGVRTAASKPAKKKLAAKPAKEKAAKTQAKAPRARTFAEKVRDCDAGTAVWFITAGSVEHATIQRSGGDGAMVIRTDAGATEVVTAGNIFETADEARAARY
jgi:hypothetical protein